MCSTGIGPARVHPLAWMALVALVGCGNGMDMPPATPGPSRDAGSRTSHPDAAAQDPGDPTDPGNPDNPDPPDAAVDDTPPAPPPPGPDASPPPPPPDASTGGSGACTNTADMTRTAMPGTNDAVANCSAMCFGRPAGCVRDCVVRTVGVSAACATCYEGAMQCAVDHCLLSCLGGSDSPSCAMCRDSSGCTSGFTTCSGLRM